MPVQEAGAAIAAAAGALRDGRSAAIAEIEKAEIAAAAARSILFIEGLSLTVWIETEGETPGNSAT